MTPFISTDKLLNQRKFSLKNNHQYGDDFWIDEKYKDNLGPRVAEKKLNSFFIGVIIVILILFLRIFYLQIIKGAEYRLLAEGNRIKTEVLPSFRGIFYDCYHNILVNNIPKFGLLINKESIEILDDQKNELIEKIAFLTNLSKDKIIEKLNQTRELKNEQDILISSDIDYQKAMIFKANEDNYYGFKLVLIPERVYNFQTLSHVLGYLGKIDKKEWQELQNKNYQFFDLIGKTGLEKQYEEILRGQTGKINKEVNAEGKVIKVLSYQDAVPGKDIVLTIDYELNKKLAEVLENYLNKNNKSRAAAVAINPKTGEILALVSVPSYDNNVFANPKKFEQETLSSKPSLTSILNHPDQPLFNRVISGQYPSGSTIKPVIALAGLEEGLITEKTQILSNGGIRIDQWFFPDWKPNGHGQTNVTKALAESVNTFFYYLGGGYGDFNGLGLERIIQYAEKFGFNQTLDIDLPGEATGFLPTKEWKEKTKNEPWYIGDTYHLSIGQGDILVTPLQIANLTVIIANNGNFFQPHLIKEILDPQEKISTIVELKNVKLNIKKENIEIVKKGLRQAVLSGSAISMNDLPFFCAAKTGTAQVGGDDGPHAWFTIFAPYENPEIVLTVLIENGGEGSNMALSVAKEVLRWYFGEREKIRN